MAKITVNEMGTRLNEVSRGQLLKELHIIALDYAAQAETKAKTRASTKLRIRSGRLVASIAGRVIKRKSYIGVQLSAGGGGDDVKYAAIHEYGGTIRPKTTKFLTIPVHESLTTKAGVGKTPSARDVPGLFYTQTRKGQPVLMHEQTGEVWYVLRRLVKIKRRPYLGPSIKDVEPKMIAEVRKVLKGALS